MSEQGSPIPGLSMQQLIENVVTRLVGSTEYPKMLVVKGSREHLLTALKTAGYICCVKDGGSSEIDYAEIYSEDTVLAQIPIAQVWLMQGTHLVCLCGANLIFPVKLFLRLLGERELTKEETHE